MSDNQERDERILSALWAKSQDKTIPAEERLAFAAKADEIRQRASPAPPRQPEAVLRPLRLGGYVMWRAIDPFICTMLVGIIGFGIAVALVRLDELVRGWF